MSLTEKLPAFTIEHRITKAQRRRVCDACGEFRSSKLHMSDLELNGVRGIEGAMDRALGSCEKLLAIGVVAKIGSCFEDSLNNRMNSADYDPKFYDDNFVMLWGGFNNGF